MSYTDRSAQCRFKPNTPSEYVSTNDEPGLSVVCMLNIQINLCDQPVARMHGFEPVYKPAVKHLMTF